ncbi:hypothetical protein OAA43_00160 [bacterium]|jgi:hypothetical protein|nr:hypothetical protein [bacterium]
MKESRQGTMRMMMKAYSKVPHHLIGDVGGWCAKAEMLEAFGIEANLSSKAGINNKFNSVIMAWEDIRQGKKKYVRPLMSWVEIADEENFANLNMAGVGGRMLMQMQTVEKTLKTFVTDYISFGERLALQYAGVNSDVLWALDRNKELMQTILE